MAEGIISAVANLERWFLENGLKLPAVIRLPDKETGMAFAYLVEKEVGPLVPVAQFRPNASWLEIRGIRFVWPMPELKRD